MGNDQHAAGCRAPPQRAPVLVDQVAAKHVLWLVAAPTDNNRVLQACSGIYPMRGKANMDVKFGMARKNDAVSGEYLCPVFCIISL